MLGESIFQHFLANISQIHELLQGNGPCLTTTLGLLHRISTHVETANHDTDPVNSWKFAVSLRVLAILETANEPRYSYLDIMLAKQIVIGLLDAWTEDSPTKNAIRQVFPINTAVT